MANDFHMPGLQFGGWHEAPRQSDMEQNHDLEQNHTMPRHDLTIVEMSQGPGLAPSPNGQAHESQLHTP